MALDHLPQVYVDFTERYPGISAANGTVARQVDEATSFFDEPTRRLLKLAVAIGAQADGAVRSNVRKALSSGASEEQVRGVALLALTTCGLPACVAGMGWIEEVLAAQGGTSTPG